MHAMESLRLHITDKAAQNMLTVFDICVFFVCFLFKCAWQIGIHIDVHEHVKIIS